MGMNDQDNDSPQPPVEQPREIELTNESLLNGENGDKQPFRQGQNRGDGSSGHRPKRRVTRRKIRVELIKEPAGDLPEDAMEGQDDAASLQAMSSAAMPLTDAVLPATGGAYAAASAPASAGAAAANGGDAAARDKPPVNQNDNRLHINDLSQMSMPDLRGLASKMGVNHEALVSMKKQEIIFHILKGHTERGGVIYAFGALEILPDGSLERGSLLLDTDLGVLDARIAPQLDRLTEALADVLRPRA